MTVRGNDLLYISYLSIKTDIFRNNDGRKQLLF